MNNPNLTFDLLSDFQTLLQSHDLMNEINQLETKALSRFYDVKTTHYDGSLIKLLYTFLCYKKLGSLYESRKKLQLDPHQSQHNKVNRLIINRTSTIINTIEKELSQIPSIFLDLMDPNVEHKFDRTRCKKQYSDSSTSSRWLTPWLMPQHIAEKIKDLDKKSKDGLMSEFREYLQSLQKTHERDLLIDYHLSINKTSEFCNELKTLAPFFNHDWLDDYIYPYHRAKEDKNILSNVCRDLQLFVHNDKVPENPDYVETQQGTFEKVESNISKANRETAHDISTMLNSAKEELAIRPTKFLDGMVCTASNGIVCTASNFIIDYTGIGTLCLINKTFPNFFKNQEIRNDLTGEVIRVQERIDFCERMIDLKKQAVNIRADNLRTRLNYFLKKSK